MKAVKRTVTITIETLSLDSVPAMVYKVGREIDSEVIDGSLNMDDGDRAEWTTKTEEVEI